MGSLFLLQRVFPTQGSNPGLPHCRWILYQLSYEESPGFPTQPPLTSKGGMLLPVRGRVGVLAGERVGVPDYDSSHLTTTDPRGVVKSLTLYWFSSHITLLGTRRDASFMPCGNKSVGIPYGLY